MSFEQKVLPDANVTPNHAFRSLISKWCENQGLTLPKLGDEYATEKEYEDQRSICFAYWHKMLSSSLEDQKKSASELQFLTIIKSGYLDSNADMPHLIPMLFTLLFPGESNSKVDPQVRQGIIAYLSKISIYERNTRVVAECPSTITAPIQALECENVETQRNAAATILALSSLESNTELIGKTAALPKLIVLFGRSSSLVLHIVARALSRLCGINYESKKRAVRDDGLGTMFKNIVEKECFEEMLAILASQ